ncbi:MAG TPA: ATP-binding protein, partial [Holophagaceae bacterium]|nr:ATP-binding protein [Holophagaceae bacterium]
SASASPESGERLGAAVESLDHMGALVEQMLFLARAEDPATALSLDSLDLSLTLSEAVRPFEPLAEERGLELLVLAPGGLTLRADPILLRRALHNLLANALRHTHEGTISLTAGEQDGAIWIEVRDTGEGIPPGLLPRLGQRFLRGDESRDRASGGTGLGLAIVQSILRLHGGRLEVASEPGKGTRARLVFPRDREG